MNKKIKATIYKRFNPKVFTIFGAYDAIDKYIFAVKQNNTGPGPYLDPYYSIDKKTLKISSFSPQKEIELFKYARQHPVEWR